MGSIKEGNQKSKRLSRRLDGWKKKELGWLSGEAFKWLEKFLKPLKGKEYGLKT